MLRNSRLDVTFFDETNGGADMAEFLASRKCNGTVFEPLRDPAIFAQAYVDLGAVTWPNGTNLAPDAMHDEIQKHGRWVLTE